jgi:hypothetical protein
MLGAKQQARARTISVSLPCITAIADLPRYQQKAPPPSGYFPGERKAPSMTEQRGALDGIDAHILKQLCDCR